MTTHDLAFGWESVSWHRLGGERGAANSESCADKNNDSNPGERRGRDSRETDQRVVTARWDVSKHRLWQLSYITYAKRSLSNETSVDVSRGGSAGILHVCMSR